MNMTLTVTVGASRPSDLSAVEAATAIARGELSSQELVASCLERIAQRDDAVKAWAYLDPDEAMAQARAADAKEAEGPLHGVPVGLKDIIDVAHMPTGFNSPIYRGYVPMADAACAAMVRKAGGLILGKTVTTEFGNRHPGPTRNPHDPSRTPGGSSSGSAAAVADRQVPLSIGTQTSGSIIRPAAFCGVVGYKPSFGEVSRVGVKQQSGSLDTLGLCGRTVGDVELLRAALIGIPYRPESPHGFLFRMALCRPYDWDTAEACSREAVEQAASDIEAAGAEVVELQLPTVLFASWLDEHRRIANFEAARNYGHEKTLFKEKLSKDLYEGRILNGERCSVDEYIAAQRKAEAMRVWMDEAFTQFDVILTLSSAGEAPRSLTNTGDARFNSLWTLLYTPCVTLPRGFGPNGLPVGIQLVCRRFEDEKLFAFASSVGSLFNNR
jgi:Asp-tRNA(Asn)/Glu-tRNA(Gln) amidotransferase A subunit family amidase